jgi:dTDP-glucose 4,6-dehydratase
VTILNTYSAQAERNVASFPNEVSCVWGSVTDREIVEKTVRGQEVVVHLAALINVDESITSPRSFLEVNLGGTLNVLEAVRQTGARLIYASSREVYGHVQDSPVREDTELQPHSPYAVSKAGADRMCFAYHTSYGIDMTILRSCNVYGERQKSGPGGAVIPIFTREAAEGGPLTVFGTGDQRREYMHVEDLVVAYDLILRHDGLAGATINVGTGETVTVQEIARYIAAAMGVSIAQKPARPGEVPGFVLETSKIRDLGFSPRIKFWDGLKAYLEFWRAESAWAPTGGDQTPTGSPPK